MSGVADASAPATSRLPAAALGFAVAAALACWNPLAAPFGLVLGVASAIVGWRALSRRRGSRRLATSAFVLGAAAAIASLAILVLSAGTFGVELPGAAVVTPRSPAETERILGDAASRTGAARKRAERELESLGGPRPQRPDGTAAERPDGGPAKVEKRAIPVPGAPSPPSSTSP